MFFYLDEAGTLNLTQQSVFLLQKSEGGENQMQSQIHIFNFRKIQAVKVIQKHQRQFQTRKINLLKETQHRNAIKRQVLSNRRVRLISKTMVINHKAILFNFYVFIYNDQHQSQNNGNNGNNSITLHITGKMQDHLSKVQIDSFRQRIFQNYEEDFISCICMTMMENVQLKNYKNIK